MAALREIKDAGLEAVGVVAPLMPLENPVAFAQALDRSCSRVIVDHYLIGDGSREGARTKRRGAPDLLVERNDSAQVTATQSLVDLGLEEFQVGVSLEV